MGAATTPPTASMKGLRSSRTRRARRSIRAAGGAGSGTCAGHAGIFSGGFFGSFFGRWAPAKRYAYGRLEWAYFFPVDEGERLAAANGWDEIIATDSRSS